VTLWRKWHSPWSEFKKNFNRKFSKIEVWPKTGQMVEGCFPKVSIFFYFFYFCLFCSILFYFVLFCSILFYFFLFFSIFFYFFLFFFSIFSISFFFSFFSLFCSLFILYLFFLLMHIGRDVMALFVTNSFSTLHFDSGWRWAVLLFVYPAKNERKRSGMIFRFSWNLIIIIFLLKKILHPWKLGDKVTG